MGQEGKRYIDFFLASLKVLEILVHFLRGCLQSVLGVGRWGLESQNEGGTGERTLKWDVLGLKGKLGCFWQQSG